WSSTAPAVDCPTRLKRVMTIRDPCEIRLACEMPLERQAQGQLNLSLGAEAHGIRNGRGKLSKCTARGRRRERHSRLNGWRRRFIRRCGSVPVRQTHRERCRRVGEVGTVEKVINLRPELEVHLLVDGNSFVQRKVELRKLRTDNGVAAQVPKCTRLWNHK